MIIYGTTEALRSLLADQNYVQKYCSVPNERDAKRSIWIAMLIYIPLTAVFLYIGTMLFAFYSNSSELLSVPGLLNEQGEVIGDKVFPHFITTRVPAGLKGLIIAAIIAAAMSTVDSALNCSATVLLLDFYKRYFKPDIKEKSSLAFLRITTVIWGVLGTGAALFLIKAESILDVWWQISGIFGGVLLGLFLLAVLRTRLRLWQGLMSIGLSIATILWATSARDLPATWQWAQCNLDKILVGAVGTAALLIVAGIFALMNRKRAMTT
jgi:SSS family solute:Na+ symporter